MEVSDKTLYVMQVISSCKTIEHLQIAGQWATKVVPCNEYDFILGFWNHAFHTLRADLLTDKVGDLETKLETLEISIGAEKILQDIDE